MIWCAKLKIIPATCIRDNNKRPACVDRLLEVKNTHIDAQPGSWDEGLLERAIRGGYGQIIRMLVERGAKISKKMVDAALVLDNLREGGGKDKVQEGEDDKEGVQEEVHDQELGDEEEIWPSLNPPDIGGYIHATFFITNLLQGACPWKGRQYRTVRTKSTTISIADRLQSQVH